MTKRSKKIILLIGLPCILGYAAVWFTYYSHVEKANKKGLEISCKENIDKEFTGRITDIETFDYDDFMKGRYFNLQITINDSTKEYVDYHFNLKPNKEILDFAKVGQKVIKLKGEDTFKLTDSTGAHRSFKIANCAAIE